MAVPGEVHVVRHRGVVGIALAQPQTAEESRAVALVAQTYRPTDEQPRGQASTRSEPDKCCEESHAPARRSRVERPVSERSEAAPEGSRTRVSPMGRPTSTPCRCHRDIRPLRRVPVTSPPVEVNQQVIPDDWKSY